MFFAGAAAAVSVSGSLFALGLRSAPLPQALALALAQDRQRALRVRGAGLGRIWDAVTASQPPPPLLPQKENPCLKMTAAKRIRPIMPFSS